MLFPVVLFGAVWADLNRPTTQAEWNRFEKEWDRRVEAWDHGQQPPEPGWLSRAWTAYQLLRGRVLATRLKEGMTVDTPEGLFGAAAGQSAYLRDRGVTLWDYRPIGVTVYYRSVPRRRIGKDGGGYVVAEVETASLSAIASLILPDRPRRR
jgi:hypothetical protein